MTTTPQAALLSEADMLDCLREATHEIPTRIPPGWRKVMQAAEKRILAKLQDGRNTPFGREAEKLADNYLDLQAQYADAVAKLQAAQEPVQAGELPALPHDGWPARFRCESCDGNGEIGELISMGHFQPPERQTCPDCGGRGWSDEGPAFNADHMRDYARAVLSARKPSCQPDKADSDQQESLSIKERKPLTRRQINEASRDAQISFCLKSGGTYEEELARAIERAHGIGLEVKP